METESIENESDVEQKIIYPLLTKKYPFGLGIESSHIKTKQDIRRFKIGKGKDGKLYFPDYLIVYSGLPIIVIEAKSPTEDLDEGFREARLYATELNSSFPAGINPSNYILATNGIDLWFGKSDHKEPLFIIACKNLDSTSEVFANIQELVKEEAIEELVRKLTKHLYPNDYYKPTRLLGGKSKRNEEVGVNSFGKELAIKYRHIFNPTSRDERKFIAKYGYIPSKRRERYIEPIDRIIRAVKPPSEIIATTISDTKQPREIIDKLTTLKPLEHQVMLLIGNIGAGKSTFIDYLQEVALPKDTKEQTVWIQINMNTAPISKDHIYKWLCEQIIQGCKLEYTDIDFDKLDIIRKIYSSEIASWNKGIGELIKDNANLYSERLADLIEELQHDPLKNAYAHMRHYATERGKLGIIVLDNCDKRLLDEQLLMFQAAE